MYQNKISEHVFVAEQKATSQNLSFRLAQPATLGRTTISSPWVLDNGVGVGCIMPNIKGAYALFTYHLNITVEGSVSSRPMPFVRTNVDSSIPDLISDTGIISPAVISTFSIDSETDNIIQLTGKCLVPVLEVADDEFQWVAVGVRTGNGSGDIIGQCAIYDREYPFYQPSK